jgi:hypothetical protein
LGWFFGHWKLELAAWAILSLSLYSFVTNPETTLWLARDVRNAAVVVACALPLAMLAWYLLQAMGEHE